MRADSTVRKRLASVLTASVIASGCGATTSRAPSTTAEAEADHAPTSVHDQLHESESAAQFVAYHTLRVDHPASSAGARSRTHRAIDTARERVFFHGRSEGQSGDELLEFGDSAVRRAWLLGDRAANLSRIPVSPPPESSPAPLEWQAVDENDWKPGHLEILVIQSSERISVELFRSDGSMRPEAIDELSEAMRDWRSAEARSIDPRLLKILYLVSREFRAPLQLVSGYRVSGVNASTTSRHGLARAADISISGVSGRSLAAFVDGAFCDVGVGYYPASGFVHIDVRDRSYYWTDRSGPAQRSREQARDRMREPDCEADSTLNSLHINESEYFAPSP